MTAPLIRTLSEDVPAAAADTDQTTIIGEVPFDGEVIGASFTPEGNVTGDTTNSRTFELINKGQDGNGTTVVATLSLITALNLTDFNEQAFTLSAVEGAVDVVEGDVLAVVETNPGTGLANPGGRIDVQVSRG